MKRSHKIAAAIVVTAGIGWAIAAAFAHPGGMGPGMMRGAMGAGMQHDAAFAGDMQLVHGMLDGHESIKRTVTNLPNGIRTVTESDDAQVAATSRAHVASMTQRLEEVASSTCSARPSRSCSRTRTRSAPRSKRPARGSS